MASFHDDFNRQNSTLGLGAPWVEQRAGNNLGIRSNSAYSSVGNPFATIDAGVSTNVTISTRLSAVHSTNNGGFALRWVDANNYIAAIWQYNGASTPDSFYFFINNNGSPVYRTGTTSGTLKQANDVLKVTVVGNLFSIYKNDVFIRSDTIDYAQLNSSTLYGLGPANDSTTQHDYFYIDDANSPYVPPAQLAVLTNQFRNRK